jgi:hypothetical protein
MLWKLSRRNGASKHDTTADRHESEATNTRLPRLWLSLRSSPLQDLRGQRALHQMHEWSSPRGDDRKPMIALLSKGRFTMSTKNGSTKAPPAPQEPAKQRPVHEVRLGRIKAAIWANETDNGVRHNVTITRLYKDGDEWKTSTSFGREELPLVAKVADLAHTWIYQQGQESNGNGSNDNR